MPAKKSLSEKETVRALGGGHILVESTGEPLSYLTGKWIKEKDGYFTVRLSGIERKPRSPEDDIPYWVKELGLENPERFSDAVVKKANRHAVLITAHEAGKHASLPEDLEFFYDLTHHRDENTFVGTVGALSRKTTPEDLIHPEKGMWEIRVTSIVLADYTIPLGKDESMEEYEAYKFRFDFFESLFNQLCPVRYHVFSKMTLVPIDGLRLKHGEVFDEKKHLTEKTERWWISVHTDKHNHKNESYIDASATVNNEIFKFVSGGYADRSYTPYTCLQGGSNPPPHIPF